MTTLSPAQPAQAARSGGALRLPPALHYTVRSTALTMKNFGFVIFSLITPLILYVVFSKAFGATDDGSGVNTSAMIMVSMAAYGSLGAAMSGGAQLALERRSGWFRQLSITMLPPSSFLWARAAVIMLIVLPALVLVFLAGRVVGSVHASLSQWATALGLMWLALIPLAILGIVIGVWVRAEVVQGLTTLTLLVMSMLGGLWFPVEFMPAAMQSIAKALPSYWLAELGRYPFVPGAGFPWTGVGVLLGWVAGLTVLGALGYRRAAANSKR